MTTPPILNYSSIPELPWLARWLMRPLGWPFFVLTAAACVWMLWECRVSSQNWEEAEFGFLILAIIWVFRAGFRAMFFAIYRLPMLEHWQGFIPFGIALWIPVIMLILISTHMPARLAFHYSKGDLQRLAASALAGTPPATPTTAGCIPIQEIYVSEDNNVIVHFRVSSYRYSPWRGFRYYWDGEGYIYATQPITQKDEERSYGCCRYEYIHGHWYRVNPWRPRDLWP